MEFAVMGEPRQGSLQLFQHRLVLWLNDAPRRCVSCQIAVPPSVLPSGLGKVLTSIGGSHSSIPQSSSHVPSALTMGHAQERQGGAVVRDTNSGARLSWPHQLPAE